MSGIKLGDLVIYTMPPAVRDKYIEDGILSMWVERSDEQHLGVVIEVMAHDANIRVWDTVERNWWVCAAAKLRPAEVTS